MERSCPPSRYPSILFRRLPLLTCRRTVTVEWGHCDPNGIVFNPHYYAWFDAALHGLMKSIGISIPRMMAAGEIDGLPLAENRTKFLLPARQDDELMIETTVTAIHRCAFELTHRVYKDGALAVEYVETRVLTEFDKAANRIKAQPLPPALAARLAGKQD